jgi:hypothetical protein
MIYSSDDYFLHRFSVEIFAKNYFSYLNANTSEPIYRRHDNLPLHPVKTLGTHKKNNLFILFIT